MPVNALVRDPSLFGTTAGAEQAVRLYPQWMRDAKQRGIGVAQDFVAAIPGALAVESGPLTQPVVVPPPVIAPPVTQDPNGLVNARDGNVAEGSGANGGEYGLVGPTSEPTSGPLAEYLARFGITNRGYGGVGGGTGGVEASGATGIGGDGVGGGAEIPGASTQPGGQGLVDQEAVSGWGGPQTNAPVDYGYDFGPPAPAPAPAPGYVDYGYDFGPPAPAPSPGYVDYGYDFGPPAPAPGPAPGPMGVDLGLEFGPPAPAPGAAPSFDGTEDGLPGMQGPQSPTSGLTAGDFGFGPTTNVAVASDVTTGGWGGWGGWGDTGWGGGGGWGDSGGGGGGNAGGGGGNAGGGAGDMGGGGMAGMEGFARGGVVTRNRLSGPNPPGPDDGYAPLNTGEGIVTKKAMDYYGPAFLRRLNKLQVPKGR